MIEPREPAPDPEPFEVHRSPPQRRGPTGCLGRGARVVAMILALLGIMIVGMVFLIEFPLRLAFGWIAFIARSIPQVDWHLPAIATGLLALLGFVIGSHYFARRLWRARAGASGSPWRWAWTLSGSALVVLLFAAGTAMVGAVHQIVWLAGSDQAILRLDGFDTGRVRGSVTETIKAQYRQHGGDALALRRGLAAAEDVQRLDLRIAVITGPSGAAEAVVVVVPDAGVDDATLPAGSSFMCRFGDKLGEVGPLLRVEDGRLEEMVAAVRVGEPLD